MARYRVIAASVNIHAGVLGLEPHQARARLHRVVYLGGNRYDVVGATFKRGEEFEYDGELPKHLVECVTSCPVPEDLAKGVPTPEAPFPIIEPDLVTDPVTDLVRDDGVAEPPPKRKKGPRAQKPAAEERAGAAIST